MAHADPDRRAERQLADPTSVWGRHEDVAAIEIRPRLAVAPDLVLRQLDPAPLAGDEARITEALRPLYEAMTSGCRRSGPRRTGTRRRARNAPSQRQTRRRGCAHPDTGPASLSSPNCSGPSRTARKRPDRPVEGSRWATDGHRPPADPDPNGTAKADRKESPCRARHRLLIPKIGRPVVALCEHTGAGRGTADSAHATQHDPSDRQWGSLR